MSDDASAYGLWSLVLLNSALIILFAFSFYKPKSSRDWRSFGMYSAFLPHFHADDDKRERP